MHIKVFTMHTKDFAELTRTKNDTISGNIQEGSDEGILVRNQENYLCKGFAMLPRTLFYTPDKFKPI